MKTPHRLVVVAVTQGSAESSKSDEKIPSWAKPNSDEPPPWAQDEPNNNSSQQEGFEIPFYAYLLASAITAIATLLTRKQRNKIRGMTIYRVLVVQIREGKDNTKGFLQQTGEKVKGIAQGATETVKQTLG
ncbi:hypothetical protein JHK84_052523 [Glycine max]|nr:hypothetical protein JHK84_052523 [Glycine max]